MSATDSLQILSQAVKLETEGLAFYLEAAEKTADPKAKALFLSLADDERMHKEVILSQLHAIEDNGAYVLLPDIKVVSIDLDQPIFPPDSSAVEEAIGQNATEQDALFVGIEMEIKSYELYRKQAQQIEGASQQMFRWLASAELTHYNLLMSSWEALNALGA